MREPCPASGEHLGRWGRCGFRWHRAAGGGPRTRFRGALSFPQAAAPARQRQRQTRMTGPPGTGSGSQCSRGQSGPSRARRWTGPSTLACTGSGSGRVGRREVDGLGPCREQTVPSRASWQRIHEGPCAAGGQVHARVTPRDQPQWESVPPRGLRIRVGSRWNTAHTASPGKGPRDRHRA